MKKLLSTFLIIFLALTFLSCTKKRSAKDIVFVLEDSPGTLDPRLAADAHAIRITQLIFGQLVKLDDNMQPVPYLAEKIENPNNTTYLITLRKGIKFHDGKPLTSDDVIYTYKSVMDPKLKSPAKYNFEKIKEIKKINAHTLKIKLAEPFAPFIIALTMCIVPKHIAEKAGEDFYKTPIGSGPFIYQKASSDKSIILASNPNYFKGKAKFENLIFKVVPDTTVRILEMLKGNIDIAQNSIPVTLLDKFKDSKDFKVSFSPSLNLAYLGLNLSDEILKNDKIRKALAYAIDKKAIINYKFKGKAKKAYGLFSPIHWVFNKDVEKYDYDPEKAKKLIKKSGLPTPIKLNYKTSTNKERIEIAKVIINQLNKVGFKVSLKSNEWGVFFADVKKGNYQIYSLKWPAVPNPDFMYYIFHTSSLPPNGANRSRLENSKLDNLLDKGRTETNFKKRKKIYAKAQEIITEELPYVFLWHEDNVVIINKRVKGYLVHPLANYQNITSAYISEK